MIRLVGRVVRIREGKNGKWWIPMGIRNILEGNVLGFVWRDWGNQRKSQFKLADSL